MELLMSNKFMEMNEQEMMEVDGGLVFTIAGLYIGAKVGLKIAAIASVKAAGVKASVVVPVTMAATGATGTGIDLMITHKALNR